jgi:sensor c-di-GMP phosphodiesterase-like protein
MSNQATTHKIAGLLAFTIILIALIPAEATAKMATAGQYRERVGERAEARIARADRAQINADDRKLRLERLRANRCSRHHLAGNSDRGEINAHSGKNCGRDAARRHE